MRPPHHCRPLAEPFLEDWDRHVARDERLATHLCDAGFRPQSTRLARTRTPTDPPLGADQHPVADQHLAPDLAAANQHLAALVARAATEPWAARVVLQRLLPGLVAMAVRRAGHPMRAHHTLDEVVATAWIVIRRYPVDHRPWAVAAGLLRDVEYEVFWRRRRLRRVREVPLGYHEPLDDARSSTFDEVLEVLVDGRDARLPPQDLALAAALASGRRLTEMATELQRTPRAMRMRRAAAAERLRRATLGWEPGEC